MSERKVHLNTISTNHVAEEKAATAFRPPERRSREWAIMWGIQRVRFNTQSGSSKEARPVGWTSQHRYHPNNLNKKWQRWRKQTRAREVAQNQLPWLHGSKVYCCYGYKQWRPIRVQALDQATRTLKKQPGTGRTIPFPRTTKKKSSSGACWNPHFGNRELFYSQGKCYNVLSYRCLL